VGDRGFSESTCKGTTVDGVRSEARMIDAFTFRDGKIAVKNATPGRSGCTRSAWRACKPSSLIADIDCDPQPGGHHALGYGGNGVMYSAQAGRRLAQCTMARCSIGSSRIFAWPSAKGIAEARRMPHGRRQERRQARYRAAPLSAR